MSEDMKKVWLVTEGIYSDYRVVAVFADEDIAREFAKSPQQQVEGFTLFDELPRKHTLYRQRLIVRGQKNGQIRVREEEAERVTYPDLEYGYHKRGPQPIVKATTREDLIGELAQNRRVSPGSVLVRVEGFDKDRVDKSFRDRVAKAKAQVMGIA